jgi:hypothetical protein
MIGSSGGTGTPTAPSIPTNLVATRGDRQITLNWSAVAGATSYRVYRTLTSGAQTTTYTSTQSPSLLDTGLTNGTTYFYRVSAVNEVGESGKSIEVSATPAAGTPPAAPVGVSAIPGDRHVTLNWNAATGATSYRIYRALTSGGQGTTALSTVSGTTYLDKDLTNGTSYYYRVSAVSSVGEGPRSAEVSATPNASTSGNLTAVGRVAAGSSAWYGELNVLLSNGAPITALTIEITVQKTPGVTYSGQYNSYWGNMLSMSSRQTTTAIIYTYRLNPGQTVPVGNNWLTAAQFNGSGSPHATSGDTFIVSATSGGVVRTITGTF